MIEVEIEDDCWLEALPDAVTLVRAAGEAALRAVLEGEAADEGEVTVLLTDDAEQQELNREHRKKNAPTNVLSFPAPKFAEPHLGDLSLAYQTCAREAAAQGKPLENHLQHLVAHGVLHLLGWDHEDDAEADEMEALERRILEGLGVPDPYAEERDARRRSE